MQNRRKFDNLMELSARLLVESIVLLANFSEKPEGLKKCYWVDNDRAITFQCDSWPLLIAFIEVTAESRDYIDGYLKTNEGKKEFISIKNKTAYLSDGLKILERHLGLASNKNKSKEGVPGPKTQNFRLENLPGPMIDECIQEFDRRLKEYKLENKSVKSSRKLNSPKVTPSSVLQTNEVKSVHNLRESGVAAFVGREEDLPGIHDKLIYATPSKRLVISGMGGVGKTEVCIQYAIKNAAFYPGGRCWINVKEGNVAEQIIQFAQISGYSINSNLQGNSQLKSLWAKWSNKRTLFIFDDVNFASDLEGVLPPGQDERFYVLITSRTQDLWDPIKVYSLDFLSDEASLTLLGAYITKERVSREETDAKKIVKFTEGLPLGLELIARYLVATDRRGVSLGSIYQELEKKRVEWDKLEPCETVINDNVFQLDPRQLTTAQRSVGAAFELTWDILTPSTREIAKIVSTCSEAHFDWRLVSIPLTAAYKKFNKQEYSPENQEKGRLDMMRYSLLKYSSEKRYGYYYHALLKDFFRSKMSQGEKKTFSVFFNHG